MSTVHSVLLRCGSEPLQGRLTHGEDHLSGGESTCWVELVYSGKRVVGTGPDFFEALLAVRRILEQDSTFVLVYGASKNVWPSGMARGMGAGMKAYRMTKGKQALTKDLVGIFESGPDVEPSTIAEQENYRDEWFASLGTKA